MVLRRLDASEYKQPYLSLYQYKLRSRFIVMLQHLEGISDGI
jgi:hypothetical protein